MAKRRKFDYRLLTTLGPQLVAKILAEDVVQAAITVGKFGKHFGPQVLYDNRGFPDASAIIRWEEDSLHLEIVKGGLASTEACIDELNRIIDKGNFVAMVNEGYFNFIKPPDESFEPELRRLLSPLLGNITPTLEASVLRPTADRTISKKMKEFAAAFSSVFSSTRMGPVRADLYPCTSGGGPCLAVFTLGKTGIKLAGTSLSKKAIDIIGPIDRLNPEDLPLYRCNPRTFSVYFFDLAWKDDKRQQTLWTADHGKEFANELKRKLGFPPPWTTS